MKANFEISYTRNGKRHVFTLTLEIYNGIAADLYDRYEAAGCENISIHMI